jgi:hypothetical protein
MLNPLPAALLARGEKLVSLSSNWSSLNASERQAKRRGKMERKHHKQDMRGEES